jgi:predicted transcriptional regulator
MTHKQPSLSWPVKWLQRAHMGTTQSVVARIESGKGTPSMRTVQRFASAVGARAVVRMEPLTTG